MFFRQSFRIYEFSNLSSHSRYSQSVTLNILAAPLKKRRDTSSYDVPLNKNLTPFGKNSPSLAGWGYRQKVEGPTVETLLQCLLSNQATCVKHKGLHNNNIEIQKILLKYLILSYIFAIQISNITLTYLCKEATG